MLANNNKTIDFSGVVLIDFGLARKLPDAIVEKENKKQGDFCLLFNIFNFPSNLAHNGTSLFTSCDAHRGCLPSFRGDLEILVHNMLYWMAGTLPWKVVLFYLYLWLW
jgi:serine/threonine protein kinase